MSLKSAMPAAAIAGILFLDCAAWAQQTSQTQPAVPSPGCHFGEVVDGPTADDARRKIEAGLASPTCTL